MDSLRINNLLFLLLVFSVSFINIASGKLGFVFEVVRHGARAPLKAFASYPFKVEPGMLTEQGMRQRYLLGRYNR
jgi:hypothetical protein